MRKIKKLYGLLYITACIAVCGVFSGAFCLLPNRVHLLEGREEKLSFHLPISASVEEESVGVLQVNNKKIEANLHISLNQPVKVKPERTGTAKVSLSLFGIIPLKTVDVSIIPQTKVIPCGNVVGVKLDTQGLMVLGTGFVNAGGTQNVEPAKGILKTGDIILSVDTVPMKKKEDLIQLIETSNGKKLEMQIRRGEDTIGVEITPVKSQDDDTYKLGVWVRDSTQGLGTVTYYNPDTGCFGALGHGVYDVDTKQLMSVSSGEIVNSSISGVKKGKRGEPGEVLGELIKTTPLASVVKNTEHGLYGTVLEEGKDYFPREKMEIALQQDVEEGPAKILSDVIDGKMQYYDVEIESINRFSNNADKGMVVRITDKTLLEKTNGIIQGMSGSPLIKDGKLIGAVTHVFVQEPTKGYAIFIENMLKEEENMYGAA